MCWRIMDWEGTFLKADLRKTKAWTWIGLPFLIDTPAYRRVVVRENGPALCWVYVAVLQIAARMPEKGLLRDERGELDANDIAAMAGLPVALVNEFLKVASGPKVRWIEKDKSARAKLLRNSSGPSEVSGEHPDVSGCRPDAVPICRDDTPDSPDASGCHPGDPGKHPDYSTLHNKERDKEKDARYPDGVQMHLDWLGRLWAIFSPRRQLPAILPSDIAFPWRALIGRQGVDEERVSLVESFYRKKIPLRRTGRFEGLRGRLSALLEHWDEDIALMEREMDAPDPLEQAAGEALPAWNAADAEAANAAAERRHGLRREEADNKEA